MSKFKPTGRELVLVESPDDLPDDWDGNELPVINGHQITLFEARCFKAYVDSNGNKSAAAKALQCTRQNFYRFEVEPWWRWLCDRYIVSEQRRTHVNLARRMHLPAPTVTYLVKQLEERGFLGRRAEPGDLRKFRLVPTDAGREALRRGREALSLSLRRRLGRLDRREVVAFDRIVGRLAGGGEDREA